EGAEAGRTRRGADTTGVDPSRSGAPRRGKRAAEKEPLAGGRDRRVRAERTQPRTRGRAGVHFRRMARALAYAPRRRTGSAARCRSAAPPDAVAQAWARCAPARRAGGGPDPGRTACGRAARPRVGETRPARIAHGNRRTRRARGDAGAVGGLLRTLMSDDQ